MNGDDAIATLNQMGYFDESLNFMSLRLTDSEFGAIHDAMSHTTLTPEQFFAALCVHHVAERKAVAK